MTTLGKIEVVDIVQPIVLTEDKLTLINQGNEIKMHIKDGVTAVSVSLEKKGVLRYQHPEEVRKNAIEEFVKEIEKKKYLKKSTDYYGEEECEWVVNVDKVWEIAKKLKEEDLFERYSRTLSELMGSSFENEDVEEDVEEDVANLSAFSDRELLEEVWRRMG